MSRYLQTKSYVDFRPPMYSQVLTLGPDGERFFPPKSAELGDRMTVCGHPNCAQVADLDEGAIRVATLNGAAKAICCSWACATAWLERYGRLKRHVPAELNSPKKPL